MALVNLRFILYENSSQNKRQLKAQKKYLSVTIFASSPTGVDEPGVAIELLHLGSQHLGVDGGVEWQEGCSEASGEGGHRVDDTDLSSGDFGGVTSNEVVHGLFRGQLGNRGQDSEGVACEEDNVLGVASNGWELGTWDELERV